MMHSQAERAIPTSALKLRLSSRALLLVLSFALLIGGAAAVRLLTYDRYLPFLDFADESNMYLLARYWRGEDAPVISEWLNGYPPLYPWITVGVQHLAEAVWTRPWIVPSEYVQVMRLVSVAAGVLTTALIATIGWQLAGAIAGWFAALPWALSPLVLAHNNIAFADPFVYLFTALAITTAIRGYKVASPAWLTVSVVTAILAIYTKYTPVYLLFPWAVATVALTRQHPRRMLPWVVGQLIVGALAAAWLIFGYGAFSLSNTEANDIRGRGLELALDPSRNLTNLYYTVLPIGVAVFAGVIVLGIAADLYSRSRGWRVLNLRWLAVLLVMVVIGVLLSAAFRTAALTGFRLRHTLPFTLMLSVVWGAGVAQLVWTLGQFNRGFAVAASAALAIITAAPMAAGAAQMIADFSRTDMRVLLWQWTESAVPFDGLILTHAHSEVEKTWNRPWSGYDGSKPFDWRFATADDLARVTPQNMVDANIRYFAVTEEDRDDLYNTPEAAAFIDQLLRLKTIPPREDTIGASTISFYQIAPPNYTANAVYGDQITLIGYDVSAETITPGAPFTFRPYWRITRQPSTNYSMFVHLYPGDRDDLITQLDTSPAPNRLTLTWTDTREVYIGSDVTLIPPETTPPGDYRLAIGLYDFTTGARLTLEDSADYFSIPITVE